MALDRCDSHFNSLIFLEDLKCLSTKRDRLSLSSRTCKKKKKKKSSLRVGLESRSTVRIKRKPQATSTVLGIGPCLSSGVTLVLVSVGSGARTFKYSQCKTKITSLESCPQYLYYRYFPLVSVCWWYHMLPTNPILILFYTF